MQDVVYMAALIAFFALAILFVVACDKIIGSDEVALADMAKGRPGPEPDEPDAIEKVAA